MERTREPQRGIFARLLLGVSLAVASLTVTSLMLGCTDETHQLPGAVKLTGSLSNGGEILTVEGWINGTGMVVVGFHPIVDGKPIEQTTSAWVGEDGKFEIPQGIEPGEYLITVRQWDPQPENDLLKGKFSERKSKIRRTIDADTELVIDISEY